MFTVDSFRQNFPALFRSHRGNPLIFMDGPGGTQVPNQVIEAISGYYKTSNSNTHGVFITTRETDEVMEQMRVKVATLLGAEHPNTISIGQNMTTLNFALARGIGRILRPGDEVLITQLDHEGNRGPWLSLRERGILVREVELLPNGTLDYADMEQKINERTRVVAIGMASNALGTVNDLKKARELSYRSGAWLVLDAVHYAPHFSIDVQRLGCDFLLCSAYKFYGPHVGLLYSRPGLLDQLQTDRLRTAGQAAPEKIETGTLNHAAIAGVSAAIDFMASFGTGSSLRDKLNDTYTQFGKHERQLAVTLYKELSANNELTIYGQSFESTHRAPTISFLHHRLTAEQVCKQLAEKNICAWDGHFYALRAIEKLGLLEKGGVTRLGMAAYTTTDEIEQVVKAIKEL